MKVPQLELSFPGLKILRSKYATYQKSDKNIVIIDVGIEASACTHSNDAMQLVHFM